MIRRTIEKDIRSKLGRGKAIIIAGPRQVGKTTLIRKLLKSNNYQFFDGDDPTVRNILTNPNTEKLKSLIGSNQIVFIDECQRIKNIGITLKIITDQMKDVQLWVSGSSSFALYDELSEPLTGRKLEFELYPISWEEYENHIGYLRAEQTLEQRLLYGSYPEVINHPGEEREILKNLVSSYLYRDLLAYAKIKKPDQLDALILALALQVGNEVNLNELSQTVGLDRNTVLSYIDILEKGFVIFRLRSFSRNVRNEIKKSRKIYFYDNGIRNAVIGNFSDLNLRVDKGPIWENFLIAERIKQIRYNNPFTRSYFWRSTQQQEVDYVEEVDGNISGYEIKWNSKRKFQFPKTFIQKYDAKAHIITRENFRTFIMPTD